MKKSRERKYNYKRDLLIPDGTREPIYPWATMRVGARFKVAALGRDPKLLKKTFQSLARYHRIRKHRHYATAIRTIAGEVYIVVTRIE